jgi:ADP-heptose:LPS heptosyltransferase
MKPTIKTTNLLLHINGGLGKVLMATAVIASYKRTFPDAKVIVVSGYPEVFVNNPYVYKNFPFATPYLWQDYYGNAEWKVSAHDPYMEPSWIKNETKHLIDIWCKMLGVDAVQKTPLLYFSGPEVDELNAMVKVDKPLMVVQSTGGAHAAARSWTRNPPLAEFDEHLKNYMETHFVLHLAVPETPLLSNVHQRVDNLNRRQAMALVHYAAEFVGIDSFGMHSRAANELAGPTTIFFPLAESVDRLGYTRKGWINHTPTAAVQQLLLNHQDYYATVFKLNIENAGENCPVGVGVKWFNLSPAQPNA